MEIIDPRIEEYVERFTTPHDPLLAELSEETARELGMTQMLTGPVAGRFLEFLVWIAQPKRVVEIGTFSGHSALSMAAAVPEGGRIDACEIDPERAAFAQRYFDRSPHGSKITLHLGPAIETIDRLEGAFDLVFIDADKTGYRDYYETVLPMLAPRAVVVVDNVLWSGRVLDPSQGDESTSALAAFNDMVAADPRVDCVMLPIRDGVSLIRLRT